MSDNAFTSSLIGYMARMNETADANQILCEPKPELQRRLHFTQLKNISDDLTSFSTELLEARNTV